MTEKEDVILTKMRLEIEMQTEKIIRKYEKRYGISVKRPLIKPKSIEYPEQHMF